MRPTLELAHHHPGRLRVRSDALARGEEALARFSRVALAIEGRPGVRVVRHNAASGSVLVEYVPGAVEPDALVDAIAAAADLEPPPPDAHERARLRQPALVAIGVTRELNSVAEKILGGRADLRTLVPMAMLGTAAYSFVTGKNRLPRWDNLTYWAFSLFQSLHAEEIARTRSDPTSDEP